jgi:hypothetical protein
MDPATGGLTVGEEVDVALAAELVDVVIGRVTAST